MNLGNARWLFLLLTAATAQAAGRDIVIGVLSPTDTGRAIGTAHQETVRFAFDHVGTVIADDVAVRLEVEYRSDRGDPVTAVAQAKDLVERGAVAIVGPVDSRSTEAVLAANLNVPVLSALSTAPALTDPRDPWFFRMTLSDDERVRQYVTTLQRYPGMMPEPLVVLYEDGNPYGEGLRDAVVNHLGLPAGSALAWSDVLATTVDTDASREAVRTGHGFTASGAVRLDPAQTIFVLGGNSGAVAIAQGLEALVRVRGARSPQFYFVGADADLQIGAPRGSITIGEPTIVDGTGNEIEQLRKEFARASRLDGESLVVTAYETAHYVLPSAIAAVVRGVKRSSIGRARDEIPPVETFRRELRDQLERLDFESIQPWRHIHLRNGVLAGAPDVPVYRIEPRFELVEIPVPQPWIEVDAPKAAGLFEGPVTLHLRPQRLEGELATTVVRGEVGPFKTVTSRLTPSSAGRIDVSFYPTWPGTYRLDTRLPTNPVDVSTTIGIGAGYPVALLGAVLGSLLFTLGVRERHQRVSPRRIAFGVLTGLILAALAFNRDVVPVGIPLPTFSPSQQSNAFWLGFAGGWVGPGALLVLLARFMPGGGQQGPQPQRDVAVTAQTGDGAGATLG